MKFDGQVQEAGQVESLPSRGARVEIITFYLPVILPHKSLPSRGARVEINVGTKYSTAPLGRSPRGERGLKWLWAYSVRP